MENKFVDENNEYLPAVKTYVNIAKQLNLVPNARRKGVQYWNRTKYKLIEKLLSKEDSGFLFPPSTLIIPSDKEELLRDLRVTLAEFYAGNTALRDRA